MGVAVIVHIFLIAAVNGGVLKALLSISTWQGVKFMLAIALVAPLGAYLLSQYVFNDAELLIKSLPSTLAFGFTGQILMFFFRNLILTKMREVRAKAFGQKIAPSQGFAKDYLLHMPEMRNEALIVFVIITVVEVAMLVVPRL